MPVDWVDESLQFARALYALKSKSGFLEVLIECTRLLETHTHAVAAAFVRLEDALTARNVVVVPDSYKVPRFAPMELAERLKHGGLDIGPLEDGPAGPVRRVSIPVSSAGPQGLFLAYCRDETIVEEGFDRHLAFMAAGLGDCLAALQVRQDLVELNTRHRAIMENIPQGVVFIAETGRRVWLNH